jgi:hypothetical protein
MNERSDGMSETCPKCGANRIGAHHLTDGPTCLRNQLAAKDAEIERLREQRVQLRKLVEHVAERNPYPPDIFIEPTKEQFTAFNAHLKEFGLDPSAYNGSMGRRTWRVCCEDILRAFDEYIEDTDEAALEQTP